jgi:predicted alpha/beta-fold hydrolase
VSEKVSKCLFIASTTRPRPICLQDSNRDALRNDSSAIVKALLVDHRLQSHVRRFNAVHPLSESPAAVVHVGRAPRDCRLAGTLSHTFALLIRPHFFNAMAGDASTTSGLGGRQSAARRLIQNGNLAISTHKYRFILSTLSLCFLLVYSFQPRRLKFLSFIGDLVRKFGKPLAKTGKPSKSSGKMLGYFTDSPITYTHATETVPLSLKSSEKTVPLHEFVKDLVPECKLHPMLFNGHLQTTWTAGDTHVHYQRRIFESDNTRYPGQFAVDFVHHPETPLERDPTLPPRTNNFTEEEWTTFCDAENERPLLICMHGLSGGSHEQYVRHMIQPLTKPGSGWDACVINGRGCAWSKLSTPVLFNARATWDMRQFVKMLRKTFPKRKLFGVGYSLGANIMTNYLGEEGDKCELSAAVIVGNPWNLDVANALLLSTWVGKNVYQPGMGAGLKKLFFRFVSKLQ